MPKAQAAALRALEIDETLAETHTALALIVENYDWDWQTAEKEFGRGIELEPIYATGHKWYAQYLTKLGRFDEALRESERARQLDPLHSSSRPTTQLSCISRGGTTARSNSAEPCWRWNQTSRAAMLG
jgi:Tfp pilus assembly protein PilF